VVGEEAQDENMSDDLISLLSHNYPSTSVAGKNANRGMRSSRNGSERNGRGIMPERINHFLLSLSYNSQPYQWQFSFCFHGIEKVYVHELEATEARYHFWRKIYFNFMSEHLSPHVA
jgi:hypothetical protein